MKKILILALTMLTSLNVTAKESKEISTAVFAGGCFWCVESDFESVKGVLKVESGYAGGDKETVTYKEVSSGLTNHTEVVKIYYDKSVISYQQLVHKFFRTIDPTVKNRQFCDVGPQYRTAIFYNNEEEKVIALKERVKVEKDLKVKIYTQIEKEKNFNLAEEYHQNYYLKNPIRYKYYRHSCGRDRTVNKIWSKV